MCHVRIDLHRKALIMAAVKDDGDVIESVDVDCRDCEAGWAAILPELRIPLPARLGPTHLVHESF